MQGTRKMARGAHHSPDLNHRSRASARAAITMMQAADHRYGNDTTLVRRLDLARSTMISLKHNQLLTQRQVLGCERGSMRQQDPEQSKKGDGDDHA